MTVILKTCTKCGVEQPIEEFPLTGRLERQYVGSWCRSCKRICSKNYYRQNKEKWKYDPAAQAAKRFNLTAEEYHEMTAEQGGVCVICGNPPGQRRLHVDHDHRTGVVRALLCSRCNAGLGQFHDSPELMRTAIEYLEKHQCQLA